MDICDYSPCKRQARYYMGWETAGAKVSGWVCGQHDKSLGRGNLMKLMPLEDAIAFDTYAAATENDDNPMPWPIWLAKRKQAAKRAKLGRG